MLPASHIDDDDLSALIDQQLSPDELARAQSHLATCAECQARLDGLRSVAVLLRRLPQVEPPRDFALGPRLLVEPPNVVRLRRWYTATRLAAAALAAMFVVLAAGSLYVDSRSGSTAAFESARPQAVLAPAANSQAAPPTVAARAAAPAAQAPLAPAQAPAAPAAGLSSAPRPTAKPQADDQVAAATSVSPLPTPVPTPPPAPLRLPISAPSVASSASDSFLTLGTAAVLAAVLAVIAVVIALVVRQRLRRVSHL